MTVAVEHPPTIDIGDGVTTTFPIGFTYAVPSDLVVTVAGVAAPYSIIGGEIVFSTAPALLAQVIIDRATPINQNADYSTTGSFSPAAMTIPLDRLTRIAQELWAKLQRAVMMPVGALGLTLPPATSLANSFLAFDPLGNPYPSAGTGTDAGLRTDLANHVTPGGNLVAVSDGAGGTLFGTAQGAISYLNSARGASFIGYKGLFTGEVQITADAFFGQTKSLMNFGASTGAADNSAALIAALNWLYSASNQTLRLGDIGTYAFTSSVAKSIPTSVHNCHIVGDGALLSFAPGCGLTITLSGTANLRNISVRNYHTTGGFDPLRFNADSNTCFAYDMLLQKCSADNFTGDAIHFDGDVFECSIVHCGGVGANGAYGSNVSGSIQPASQYSTVTGSITGGIFTVTGVTGPALAANMTVPLEMVSASTRIINQLTGTPGGAGTYAIDNTTAVVASTTFLASMVGYGIHLRNGAGGGISSSIDIFGGSWRYGISGFYAESPASDFRMYGGTYLFGLLEGARVEAAIGTAFFGVHVEGNWQSVSTLAAGGPGLVLNGSGTIFGVNGANNFNQCQAFTVGVFATSGGVVVSGGGLSQNTTSYGRYQIGLGGDLTLIGKNAQNYTLVGSQLPTHVGLNAVTVQTIAWQQDFAYTATYTPDCNLGTHFVCESVTGPITIANPINMATSPTPVARWSNELKFSLCQDGTGSRTVTWGSNFAGGMATFNTTPNTWTHWTVALVGGKLRQMATATSL